MNTTASAAFKAAYLGLNPAQKQAVDTIEGPVMVLAGPGTGKTQVLATRIAQILLETDTPPSSVLALTFTESAAQNMRERLVKLIGKVGYYVHISTFHAFCSDVIQQHPEFFSIQRGSEPLSDLERYDLFESILSELKLEVLKPLNQPFFYIKEVIKAISDLKREGISSEEFAEIVEQEAASGGAQSSEKKPTKTELARFERQLAKQRELCQVYEEYQRRLRELLRYDFDDMIALVAEAFENEEALLQEYQEKLLYFLVDEYQDTNSAQNQVVDLLASYWGEQANIFVVGDPNQAIYRFQGASVENTLSFSQRYQSAQIISLEVGYRSTPLIYQAAASLISNNNLQLDATVIGNQKLPAKLLQKLSSVKISSQPISLLEAPSQLLEISYVAETIKNLIDQKTDPAEIAVLYRHNRDAAAMQEALNTWGVEYETDGGSNILDQELVTQLLNFLTVIDLIATGGEQDLIYEVLLYEWIPIDGLLVMKVVRVASQMKLPLVDCIQRGYEHFIKAYGGSDVMAAEFETLAEFIQRLQAWKMAESQQTLPVWFEQIMQESGYLDFILAHKNKPELLLHLNSLFREIKGWCGADHSFKLSNLLQIIATMREHDLGIQADDIKLKKNAVTLSTVHRAKGQEWAHVFIIHCIDGKWGNAKKRELLPLPQRLLKHTDVNEKEQNEDERRLMYVALTRAKEYLTISYAQTMVSGNRSKDVIPSMFITELVDEQNQSLLTPIKTDNLLEKADEYLTRLLQPSVVRVSNNREREFFAKLVSEFKLSVTALNTYLRDPHEFVLNVLLKVPRAKPEPMAFGTAVHRALEKLYQAIQENGQPLTLPAVLNEFEHSLRAELLSSNDFDRRLIHGQQVLTKYYEQLVEPYPNIMMIERFFGSGFSKPMLDDIELTGRVDRIDWLNPAEKIVRVVDYKTGASRTDSYILGTLASMELSEREQILPLSVRGPYKRQLLFYKLLTELDHSFVPTVTEGMFEFVEPNDSGKIVRRIIELPDSEVEDLKILIREVMAEIRSLKFLELL